MKNVFKFLGIIALVAVIGFGFVSCGGDDGGGGDNNNNNNNNNGGNGSTFTTIAQMDTWLKAKPQNTAETPYSITLNVSDLGDPSTDASVSKVLKKYGAWGETRYVILDLSGSTFTSIGDSALSVSAIIGITIPNSVTSIGQGAFQSCDKLASVAIPSGVTSIGNNAFEYCSSLTSVTIPNSVTSIGVSAFSSRGLTSVTFQGETIYLLGDNNTSPFYGDLKDKYRATTGGGAGT